MLDFLTDFVKQRLSGESCCARSPILSKQELTWSIHTSQKLRGAEKQTMDYRRGGSTIHPYQSSLNPRDLFKNAVQSPLNQVEKTQLEYAVRSQPRETCCWTTSTMVVQNQDSCFVLPLNPDGR